MIDDSRDHLGSQHNGAQARPVQAQLQPTSPPWILYARLSETMVGQLLPNQQRQCGETDRVVHVFAEPVATQTPDRLTALCGQEFESGQLEHVEAGQGMPCDSCSARARRRAPGSPTARRTTAELAMPQARSSPQQHTSVSDELSDADIVALTHDAQASFELEHHTALAALRPGEPHSWDAVTIAAAALSNLSKAGLIEPLPLDLELALRTDGPLAAVFQSQMAFALTNLGHHDAAIAAATEAVSGAIALDDPPARSVARSTLGHALLAAGRPRQAIAVFTVALADNTACGDRLSAAQQHRRIGHAHLSRQLNDPTTALVGLWTSVDLMRELDDCAELARSLIYLAEGLVAAEQPASALHALDESAEITRHLGPARDDAHRHRIAAVAHHLLGDIRRAVQQCNRALAALPDCGPGADTERAEIEELRQQIVAWDLPPLDLKRPGLARIVNHILGGNESWSLDQNFVSRVCAEHRAPMFRTLVKAMFEFQFRAVHDAAGHGVRQFLAVECGIPGPDSVHAQLKDVDDARVVYAYGEEHAVAITDAITAGMDHVGVVAGDVVEPETFLYHLTTTWLIDFDEPVCVVLTGALHYCPPGTDLLTVVRRVVDPLAPGSLVILSCLTVDGVDPATPEHDTVREQLLEFEQSSENEKMLYPIVLRDKAEIAGFLPDITYSTPMPGCFAAVGRVH